MKRLGLALLFLLVGGVGAAIGFAVAMAQARNTLGPVLLQHASAVVHAAESPILAGKEEQQALQLDIMSTLTQVAALRPDVAGLDAYALEGLCLLHRAVKQNTVGFSAKQLEVVALMRPYIQATETDLEAIVSSTDPLFLRPGCRAAKL